MESPITTSDSSETDDQVEPNVNKIPTMEEEISKRPWTPADSNSHWPKERICNQCGKAFPSLRELCGHIKAAHSDNDKDSRDDDSPSTSSDSDRSSDMEIKNPRSRSRSRTTDEKLKGVVSDSSSSSDSDIDGCEVKKAAKCLIMLKRDSFFHNNNSNINSVVQDMKSYLKEAPMIDSDSEYFLQECGDADLEVAFDGKPKNRAFYGSEKPLSFNTSRENVYQNVALNSCFAGIDSKKRRQIVRSDEGHENSKKRSRYECDKCKKTFMSYQALGGHRPCHKTIDDHENKTRHEVSHKSLKYSREQTNAEDNPGSSKTVKPASKSSPTNPPNAKKNKAYVCPYCDKVFKNGQALGGHKRSHFLGGLNVGISTQVNKTNKTDLLSFLQQEDADDQVEEDDNDGIP